MKDIRIISNVLEIKKINKIKYPDFQAMTNRFKLVPKTIVVNCC